MVANRTETSPCFIALCCLMLGASACVRAAEAPAGDAPPPAQAAPAPPADPDQASPADPDQAPDSEAEALRRVKQPFDEGRSEEPAKEAAEKEADACDAEYWVDHWEEETREFFRSVSCHSFRWFDSLFGHDIDYPEEAVSGLAVLGGGWRQYDGFDGKARFRVRAPLPNLDRRWNLILGRGDEDAFISDTETQDKTFYNPGLVNRNDEDSVLLGLGGRDHGGRTGWDWSAGVRLRTPPIPYLRLRWNYYKAFSPDTDLRFRQTFFWRKDDGFGVTARGDLAHAFRVQDVMRWESVLTNSEASRGTEWYIGQTWYHLMRERRAFSILAFAYGETDGPVDLKETGLNFIWRQPFNRDWLWISYGPSATWPRFARDEERELSLGFNVWLEMEFGSWHY